MVYRHRHSVIDRVLIDRWTQQSLDTLNRATDQVQKGLIMVIKGDYFEFHID